MKNKVKLKRFIFKVLIFTICLIGLFLTINIYKQHIFTKNYNTKIVQIISKVKEEYPDLDENKLITILNSDKVDVSLLQKYSININKDDLLLENVKEYKEMLIINTSFIIITIIVCLITFLKFNSKKDKEINEITKYIEEINRKNYKLNIDDMSEDELSILKNEVYKTTIMLKEAAENSNKEKLELKDSLSDISHQLKTPLTSILIILNNLIDDPDMDKEIREDFIRDIKMEITNISFLVQSILKLSKLDTNTVDFIEEKTYIKDIVDEVIKNISTLCDLRNIKIITKYKENAQIICDFRWQVEAFSNIIKNCIERIRRIAPDTYILVGGYWQNSPDAVPDLEVPYDDKVIYNFHCYDPLMFTHQGAYWVENMDKNFRLPFDDVEPPITPEFFIERFSRAYDAAKENGTVLYCGEYGVIDLAKPEDALKWFKAINTAFDRLGISRAVWSYKKMDFGISDSRMDKVRNELIQYL